VNFSTCLYKQRILLYFLLVLNFDGYAQKIKYSTIDLFVNTDSLEKHLIPNQPPKYLEQLLILEWNWARVSHAKFGSKLNEVYSMAVSQKRKDVLPICEYMRGLTYLKQRQHTQTFVSLNKALKGFESQADTAGLIVTYCRLANLNLTQTKDGQKDIEAGIEYAQKAVKWAETWGNKSYLIYSLAELNIGYTYSGDKKDLEKKTAERQLKLIGTDPALQFYSLSAETTLALLEEEKGNYQEAYRLIKPSVSKAKKYLSKFFYNGFVLNLVSYCIELKKYDEASRYLAEVLDNTKDKEFWLLREDAFNKYKRMYQAQKVYQKALAYADSSNILRTEIQQNENIEALHQLEVTYKTKEIKAQNTALSKENVLVNSRNNAILLGLVVAGVLTLLLLTVLFYLYRSQKEAKKQAEEIGKLSKIRDQYLKIIAHDIRSPIFALQDMYQMLKGAIRSKRYADIEKISHYIDETGVNTRRLLDNLLNWGMSQQEEVPYSPEKINLSNVIQEITNVYAGIKVVKGFDILIVGAEGVEVYADLNGLKLVLRNLLDNAIKNLPTTQGQVVITVTQDLNSQQVIVTIKDNGTGIVEEKLAVINQVFKNPHVAQAGQEKLGLGTLLISKFVQKNKGSIIAQPKQDQGSSFVLTLPQEQKTSYSSPK
jgi:signal transduction histidine kinase